MIDTDKKKRDTIMHMIQLAKVLKLVPAHCHDVEFTMGSTVENEVVVFGLDVWEGNTRYNSNGTFIEPQKIDIPTYLRPMFNCLGSKVIFGHE